MTQQVKIYRPNKQGDLILKKTIRNPGFNHDTYRQSMKKKRKRLPTYI